MIEKIFNRQLLLVPVALRSSVLMRQARHVQLPILLRRSSSAHSIIQPSFWASLVPKPFRRTPNSSDKAKEPKSSEWNPATFFIIILLLIGSMSIQMIALRNDFAAFSRRADVKIGLLREIIQRVQNGEEVDVERLLGTGDSQKEKEWEEALQEIEKEEELWADRRKKPRRFTETKGNTVPAKDEAARSDAMNYTSEPEVAKPKQKFNAPPGFY